MAYEFRRLSGRAGVCLTSETLAANLTMLALMQGDVSQNAVISVPPRILPLSKVGDNAVVDTTGGVKAGTVIWEESDGEYRVVQVGDTCYFQEKGTLWGWNTVEDDNRQSLSCSIVAWSKQGVGAFSSAGGLEMSALAGQLNLDDFRQSFMDAVLSSIRDQIIDQIRDPARFLGSMTVMPLAGGRSALALGKVSLGISNGAVLRSGAVLNPSELQAQIRNVLIGMTDLHAAKRKITAIATDFFARARTLTAAKAASSNA